MSARFKIALIGLASALLLVTGILTNAEARRLTQGQVQQLYKQHKRTTIRAFMRAEKIYRTTGRVARGFEVQHQDGTDYIYRKGAAGNPNATRAYTSLGSGLPMVQFKQVRHEPGKSAPTVLTIEFTKGNRWGGRGIGRGGVNAPFIHEKRVGSNGNAAHSRTVERYYHPRGKWNETVVREVNELTGKRAGKPASDPALRFYYPGGKVSQYSGSARK